MSICGNCWEKIRSKQRDTKLRETQGNDLPFLEVCLAAARLPVRKLNFQVAPHDLMILILLIHIIQVDTSVICKNPNSNNIFLKNYTYSTHSSDNFKYILANLILSTIL